MSEQPNPLQANTLATVLDGAKYLDIAQAALGTEIMPEQVKLAVQAVMKPDGVTWEGSPIWLTAYYAGLREHVLARRASASEGGAAAQADAEARNQSKMRITTRLDVANNVIATPTDALPSATWADPEGPRADFQVRYGNILRWAAVMPPRTTEELPAGGKPIMQDAIVLPAPTGVGKTLLGGNYLAAAGVGQEAANGKRKRALWITISQQLITDILNEDKTMQKTLPEGATTTAIWEGSKDESSASGDLVAITVQSLEEALTAIEEGREPLLNPQDFDILMFDEAHESLSPRVTQLLERFDCQKVLLTATPARSNWISLLNRYHHVPPMGRREAIEEGLLSPVHIVSIMAEDMPHAEHQAALAAVDFFIKHGKKATIYCQPGGENAQARRIAKLIDVYAEQIMGDAYNPGLVYAEMVGSANANSQESIAAFEGQTHGGVRTTSQMLGVGWDPVELDGSIWVGPQGDFLALMQESGRSVRPKADGRAAWWIHINTPIPEGSRTINYGLPQTVGLEEVPPPDWEIGRPPDWARPRPPMPGERGGGRTEPGPSPWRPGAQTGPGGAPGPMPSEGSPGSSDAPETGSPQPSPSPDAETILSGVSEELARSFITPHTPLAEIIIEPGRRDRYIPPPEFSVTDEQLAERFNVPVSFIHYYLDAYPGAPDVSYKSLRTMRVPGLTDEARGYIRHYHAEEVEIRLAARPIPRMSDAIYAVNNIARALHAPDSAIYEAIKVLRLPDRPPTRTRPVDGMRTARAAPRYTLAEYTLISDEIARTPVAAPQDQTWQSVAQQYPLGAKMLDPELDRQRMRHPPTSDRKGTESFVLAERVREVAAEDERRRPLVTAKEAADRAGVTLAALQAGMNSEERAFFDDPRNRFAPLGGTKNSRHLTRAMSDAIVERIGPEPLRYDEVTFEVIKARVADSPSDVNLRRIVAPYAKGEGQRRIGRLEYPVLVFDIQAMRAAEARFGRNPEQAEINYDWFAIEAADPSDELVAYARTMQTDVLGVNPLHLAPDRTRDERLAAAQQATGGEAVAEKPAGKPTVIAEAEQEQASEFGIARSAEAAQEPAEAEEAVEPQPASAPHDPMTPLTEIIDETGRPPVHVMRILTQLGFADRILDDSLPTSMAEQVVQLLGRNPAKKRARSAVSGLAVRFSGVQDGGEASPTARAAGSAAPPAKAAPAKKVTPAKKATAAPATPTPPPVAAAEKAPAAPAPDSPRGEVMSLEEIGQASERTPGAVASAVRQLGLEDDARSGSVSHADGLQLIKLLTGGKKSLATGAVGAAAAAGATAPGAAVEGSAAATSGSTEATTAAKADTPKAAAPAPEVPLRPGQEFDDGIIWWNTGGEHGVLAELNCTPAAFAYLVNQARIKGTHIRQMPDGRTQLSAALVANLKTYIARIRQRPPNTDMMLTHERLAQNMEIEPDKLMAYMRNWMVSPGGDDLTVRCNMQRGGLVELMYAENRWRRVMATKGRRRP
jgi:hypothetical protein